MKKTRLFKFVSEKYVPFDQKEIDEYRRTHHPKGDPLTDEEVAREIHNSKNRDASYVNWEVFEVK